MGNEETLEQFINESYSCSASVSVSGSQMRLEYSSGTCSIELYESATLGGVHQIEVEVNYWVSQGRLTKFEASCLLALLGLAFGRYQELIVKQ